MLLASRAGECCRDCNLIDSKKAIRVNHEEYCCIRSDVCSRGVGTGGSSTEMIELRGGVLIAGCIVVVSCGRLEGETVGAVGA